jgi:hypothetical protein
MSSRQQPQQQQQQQHSGAFVCWQVRGHTWWLLTATQHCVAPHAFTKTLSSFPGSTCCLAQDKQQEALLQNCKALTLGTQHLHCGVLVVLFNTLVCLSARILLN